MDKLRRVENYHSSILEDRGFRVYEGWSDTLAQSVVKHSTEDTIKRSTPGDHLERFTDLDTARQWHENGPKRYIYGMFHAAGLAGLIWYGNHTLRGSEMIGADWTFAIRLYDDARGHGLSRPFMLATEQDFRIQSDSNANIWLMTDESNRTAQHLYEKVGYSRVATDRDRVLMVKKSSKE